MITGDPGIEAIGLSPFAVSKRLDERLHVGILFKVAEQIKEKKTDRVIVDAVRRVPVGDEGADGRKVDEGGQPPVRAPLRFFHPGECGYSGADRRNATAMPRPVWRKASDVSH